VLSEFNTIRELNMSHTNLMRSTTKEIADGLMRAKQLEILKLAHNPGMRDAVSQVIYNLAFSPKVRIIDLRDSSCGHE